MKEEKNTIMSKFVKPVFYCVISGSLPHLAKIAEGAKCMSLNNEASLSTPTARN